MYLDRSHVIIDFIVVGNFQGRAKRVHHTWTESWFFDLRSDSVNCISEIEFRNFKIWISNFKLFDNRCHQFSIDRQPRSEESNRQNVAVILAAFFWASVHVVRWQFYVRMSSLWCAMCDEKKHFGWSIMMLRFVCLIAIVWWHDLLIIIF